MRKAELSKLQLRDLNLFNLILEAHGWEDPHEIEHRLDLGELVNPEASRVYRNAESVLEARFHAPVNMISVRIHDLYGGDRLQIHFLYETHPEHLLEWLSASSDELTFNHYAPLLKAARAHCEMILLEISDNEIYEVKPPTKA